MKTLLLAGALLSSAAPSAIPATRSLYTSGCDSDYGHEINLIDLDYQIYHCPRYILSNIEIDNAEYFTKENDSYDITRGIIDSSDCEITAASIHSHEPIRIKAYYGEVDRSATYHQSPDWYKASPATDPHYDCYKNQVHLHTEPISFSQTLGSISHFLKRTHTSSHGGVLSPNDDLLTWTHPTTSAQDACKLKFTFRDTTTLEEEAYSLYFNGGTNQFGYDNAFVGIIPGTRRYVDSNGVTKQALNVNTRPEHGESGTYENVGNPEKTITVPMLFNHELSFKQFSFPHATRIKKLNDYMMACHGGHDPHWGNYSFNLLDGFKWPSHNPGISRNFIQGRNVLYRVANDFAKHVYTTLNS